MYEISKKLYYMAPSKNAIAIASVGILSYNKRHSSPELEKISISIADPFVNSRRHVRHLNGRSLHDYVPLYWATHTPMQYVVTIRDGTLSEDDLVFFVLDSNKVLEMPGVITTDGNAASNETVFYEGPGALPHLCWKIIRTPNCYSRDYKRRKCAEVLVPDCIPTSGISYVAVRTEQVAAALRSQLKLIVHEFQRRKASLNVVTDVRVSREHYYN